MGPTDATAIPTLPHSLARRTSRGPRLGGILVAALLVAGVGATTVLAQSGTALENLHTGETVVIAAGETVDSDLYVFAGTVRVAGTVNGDLVAAAGQLDVTGTVTGDVIGLGGQVNITGTVDGDVRLAAGQVTIGGTVAEDALASGGQVTISAAGQVGGDLIVSAGQLTLDGAVAGSAVGTAGGYSRTGQIGGVDDVRISERQVVDRTPATQALDAVRHFVVALALGALMLWLTPGTYHALRTELRTRPLRSAGLGLLALIGTFVLVIALLVVIVLVAIPLGALGFGLLTAIELLGGLLALGLFTILTVAMCAWFVDVVVGSTIASLIPQDERSGRWMELGVLAAGIAVVVFLGSIPVVGPWVKFVVIVLGLGAWLARALAWWRRRRPAGPQTAMPASSIPAPPPA
jgi:cytoskeletal protein CcmA (bactofilin family)